MSGRVPPSSRVRAREKAARLYEDFTGHDASASQTIQKPIIPDVLAYIGQVTAIAYVTVRDGKIEDYIHEFSDTAGPHMCISPDGKGIWLIGGHYEFTERGIVDKRLKRR